MNDKTGKTWVVVADGARARIFQHEAKAGALKPVFDHDFLGPSRVHTSDIVSDKPGEGRGGGLSAPRAMAAPTDWHRNAKHEFARNMARVLDDAATRNEFARLVLVAPPQALGDLRECLNKTTRSRVVSEVNKDLTTLNTREVPEHLRHIL
jgi:protein required for attachment to host cells